MFGYIMPVKGELKIREYDVFKAYYCSLCNEIGKKSYISKFTITYDMTFLSILLSALYRDKELAHKKFCPFKMRKVMIIGNNPYLDYAADMNILLSNRKLLDNYFDEKNYFSYFASKIINTKKISLTAASKIQKIDMSLRELSLLEKSKCNSIDEVGHCFAEVTAEIFSTGEYSRILKLIGYNLGKWIYTIDAYDDLIEDLKDKRYNPFIYSFNYNGEDPVCFKNKIKDRVEFILIKCLSEVSKSVDLLELKKDSGIIENIVYMGLEAKTKNVIEGGCKNEKSI